MVFRAQCSRKIGGSSRVSEAAGGRRAKSDAAPGVRSRLVLLYLVLAAMNLGAWAWAAIGLGGRPALLGIALVVYGLGLRHAVDADHIAAIDNVTRKLLQAGKRPVGVGFFFALGHSAVVTLVAAAVAGAAHLLGHFKALQDIGAVVGAGVSASFLFAMAAVNLVVFVSVWRTYRRVRAGAVPQADELGALLNGGGIVARLLRPLFRLIDQSWQMLLLGLLFGLGFDTATEVAMFGVSATQLAHGLPLAAVLAFPALFAAGMSLVDATNGVMMLGAYAWAFVRPLRKLYYNMAITLTSVVVAVLIGGLEAAGLAGGLLRQAGAFWRGVAALNGQMGAIGLGVIAVFAAAWGLSFLVVRLSRPRAEPALAPAKPPGPTL
jgi:nickel/cobalt transporter (NiCoT) family protein